MSSGATRPTAMLTAGPRRAHADRRCPAVLGRLRPRHRGCLTGQNIGDQLNTKDLSWGWFQGGFAPTTAYTGPVSTASITTRSTIRTTCPAPPLTTSAPPWAGPVRQPPVRNRQRYSAHYDGLQFYASTANPHHLRRPRSTSSEPTRRPGRVRYRQPQLTSRSSTTSSRATKRVALASHFPAVSYLKAPVYETGHPATSDPIDEQNWLVNEVNSIEQLPTWDSTAIFITYDDSDGWYDHVSSGVQSLGYHGRQPHRQGRVRDGPAGQTAARSTTSRAAAASARASR